jgi:branched-chain amino acid transport system substrate-binding protein
VRHPFRPARSVAALSLLALVTTGCVSGGGGGTTTTSNSPVTGGTINIGLIAPLSGLGLSIGRDMMEGAQVAVDELNAQGGVLGNQVQLIQRDNQADPAKTTQAARDLIDGEHVQMIIGPPGLTAWQAIRPIIDQAHVVDYPILTDPIFKQINDKWSFRIMIPDDLQIPPLVGYAASHFKRIAMIAEGDQTGAAEIQLAKEAMAKHGKSLVDVETFPIDSIDWTAQVLALKKANPDAVIIGTQIGIAGANILKYAQLLDFHPQWLGLAGLSSYTLADLAKDATVGLIFVGPKNPVSRGGKPTPQEVKFVTEYIKKYYPNGIRSESGANKLIGAGFLTYDGVKMWAAAAEKAKSYLPDAVDKVYNDGFTFGPADSAGNLTWEYSASDHEGFHAKDAWLYRWVKDAKGIEYKYFADATKYAG